MVEFALVILLFLGMVLAIIEGARLVASHFTLSNAAAEGARAGAFVPTTSLTTATIDNNVRTAVRRTVVPWVTIPDSNITICRRATRSAACGTTPVQSGSVIEVTATYTFRFVPFAGGWLGRANIPLTGHHVARIH